MAAPIATAMFVPSPKFRPARERTENIARYLSVLWGHFLFRLVCKMPR